MGTWRLVEGYLVGGDFPSFHAPHLFDQTDSNTMQDTRLLSQKLIKTALRSSSTANVRGLGAPGPLTMGKAFD